MHFPFFQILTNVLEVQILAMSLLNASTHREAMHAPAYEDIRAMAENVMVCE